MCDSDQIIIQQQEREIDDLTKEIRAKDSIIEEVCEERDVTLEREKELYLELRNMNKVNANIGDKYESLLHAALSRVKELEKENNRLRESVEWALGIIDGEDEYYTYWSGIAKELRRRAGLVK